MEMEISLLWMIGFSLMILTNGLKPTSDHTYRRNFQILQSSEEQPYRTSYHFQPPKNWMNDPNGPMYYKGVYHLFYQYNPYAAIWGNIVWAHSTSVDLVNWVHLDHAISPTDNFDLNGCWSGSATILPGNKPMILYTGSDATKRQVQNLAVPKNLSDPLLKEWVKIPQNPLMSPVNGINSSNFRDPTTAWRGFDGKWRILVGNEKEKHQGMALLYRSKDFLHWTKSEHPLHSSSKTGMWECPDFFPVSITSSNGVDTSVNDETVKHVLKASYSNHDYYTLGKYVAEKERYVPDKDFTYTSSDMSYDYGKFYASKSFFDKARNRRILWGWINESDSETSNIEKGWSGLQSVPRKIWLSRSGTQLLQWPIKEIETLRTDKVNLQKTDIPGSSIFEIQGIKASQADIEVSFELPKLEEAELMDPSWVDPQRLCSEKCASVKGQVGPFGLLVLASKRLEEQTAIFFRVYRRNTKYVILMCSDQTRSSLRKDLDKTTYGAYVNIDPSQKKLSLRTLIDHSIVESFGGEGKTCITARIYPKLAINNGAHLYVFNNGTSTIQMSELSAWTMREAQIK